LSFRASYCFSFFTFAFLLGTTDLLRTRFSACFRARAV